MALNQQQQQIIVIPGNMLIGSKQNAGGCSTMEQVRSILKLANVTTTTSNTQQNLQVKTIVTSANGKFSTTSTTSSKAPSVILPSLVKNTATNAAILRPVHAINKVIGSTTAVVPPNNSISIQPQASQNQHQAPRVISLKRPYSSITTQQKEVSEPNVIKLSTTTSSLQSVNAITTDTIKEESSACFEQTSARKRANLDHMSPDEKMMRRKLKNRVAAQNARDKKRVKMDEMDDKIKKLEDENKRIIQQNEQLLEFNRRLVEQNQRLSNNNNSVISRDECVTESFIKKEPTLLDDMESNHNNRVLYIPPESPESLPRSPSPTASSISSSTMTSQQQRISSLDDDSSSSIGIGSSISVCSDDASHGVSSLVEQRSPEPAARARSTFGRGRDNPRLESRQVQQQQQFQIIGTGHNSAVLDMFDVNSSASGQQFVIAAAKQEGNDTIIKREAGKGNGASSNDFVKIATKEENDATSERQGEDVGTPTDIDDSWFSDLLVMNPTTATSGDSIVQALKQAEIVEDNAIFTPSSQQDDTMNYDTTTTTDVLDPTSLLDKYLTQQQRQLEEQQHLDHPMIDNDEFDSYFNELFPDLAI